MTYEYQVKGQKVILEPDENFVAVRYREPAPLSKRAAATARAGTGPFTERYEVPKEKFTIVPVGKPETASASRQTRAIASLRADQDVATAMPVFKHGPHHVVPVDRVLVGFRPGAPDPDAVVARHGGRVIERFGSEALVRLAEDADTLAVAKALAAEPDVTYAEPDFVTVGRHVARGVRRRSPGASLDPDISRQYAARITRAEDAWTLQKGDPSIRIAILDEGVDTLHEDLASTIAGTYDATDDDSFQEPNRWDGHGTACAGLAAAEHGNARGIQGIGGGCSVLAVRIAYSEHPHGDWVTNNSWIRRAVDWAWQNGAAVLSNSWGGGAPSSAIVNAFERARSQGREGKGCVVVVAAGNAYMRLIFPADLPGVLTVSASNEYDEFKTPTSRDGETWWGSSYGPEVDVAAPGVHNWTTDITGDAGYTSGNYTDFNGTSSATPIVAGLAGLLLSADPGLPEGEVRQIIRETADKVGAMPYRNDRNDQMGHGRVNALAAVRRVLAGRRQADVPSAA